MLLASLFFVLGTAWADAPVVGQRYRLKNVTTGLYMQANGTSNLQLQKQKYSVLQFFSVEDAGNGKFFLKSETGTNNYVNASAWDAVVTEGANTPYEIELVSGETDVYTLHQTVGLDVVYNVPYHGKIGSTSSEQTWLFCNMTAENNVKWKFEPVEYPTVCTFDSEKIYRIKSEYSGLYMQMMSVGTSGETDGAFQLKNKSEDAEEQKFMLEAATGDNAGKYYLKTVKNGTTYYVNQGSWNFHAGTSATTPFTISVVEGHTAVYTLHQTLNPGYAGLETENVFVDGTNIYCNQPAKTGNTIWPFEEVDAPSLPDVQTQTYILNIIGAPQDVTVTYEDQAITNGGTITINGGINVGNLWATDLEGYTKEFTVKDNIITLTYTKVEGGDEGDDDDDEEVETSLEPVVALINRIGGEGAASKFELVLDPSLAVDGKETFVLGSEGGKVLIKGSTLSAITTGIGWYLNNVAHINIAWNSLNEATGAYADLSGITPPTSTETHTSDAQYRYYLNYCTFGYSMSTWTWERWQKEIDWMALHGVNMPLQIVGLEVVWRNFLLGNGYTEEAAESFIAGPSFTPWWAMNNLEGWGGTTNNAWFARQENLAKQILARQRELGMEPVLPGFSGMMPSTKEQNGGNWCNFTRPQIISPTAENFETLAAAYYACLEAVMGKSQYYSMDPFHEGAGDNATAEAYTAIYNAMEKAKSGSQWLIQQWQWYGGNQALSLTAVPEGKLIVLDLFSDGQPEFDKYGYNGYAPQDAMFCVVPNFGGRSGLMGRLQSVVDGYFNYKGMYANLKGICTAPESIEQTPITYDLVYQLPWMDSKPDVATWVANYTVARYGQDNEVVKAAWDLLRQGPLNYNTAGIQGPVEDVWAARPNLDANPASFWGKTLSTPLDDQSGMTPGNIYIVARRQMLIDAVYKLLAQKDALALVSGSIYESNYNYDIVEFGSAVMADYAHDLLLGIKAAKEAGDANLYEDRKKAFLQLILDMDAFKGTNLNFRLGKWTEGARAAAAEVDNTTATADWYEFDNARTLITTWGDYNQSNYGGLRDYSYRSWQGLLKDYYYPRWEYYFKNGCTHPGGDVNNYFYFEWNWAHGMECSVGQTEKSTTPAASRSYSATPVGDAVAEANKLLGKYLIHITARDGSHVRYAYRHLNNDLEGRVSINATASAGKIDLTKYFEGLENAAVTIDGKTATDIANMPVSNGQHVCSITLEDGTSFDNITIVVGDGSLAAGYYHIYFKDDTENASIPLFIGYNEDDDDWVGDDHKGYKMLGQGAYTTDAEGDKIFTLVPQGDDRFTISAQGKHLLAPNFNTWNHIQFSDDASAAGVYEFHSQDDLAGGFKIQGLGESKDEEEVDPDHETHNDYLQVYGLDPVRPKRMIVGPNPKGTASNFLLTPVTSYTAKVPASGVLPLCLPFNVVLPEGVVAYDIVLSSLTTENMSTGDVLTELAKKDETIKAGTPVILKAAPGDYVLNIDIIDEGATPSEGSVLRGNFVKETVHLSSTTKRFVLEDDQFEVITSSTEIPANGCWVEANIQSDDIELVPKYIDVATGWKFRVKKTGKGLTITEKVEQGTNSELKFDSEYYYSYSVNGVSTVSTNKWEIIAISDQLLAGNEFITEVHFPKTLTSVGSGYANKMFEMTYCGVDNGAGENIGVPEDTGTEEEWTDDEQQAYDEAHAWIGAPHTCKYKILGTSTWRMTMQVTKSEDAKYFNDYGSCLLATKENTLADDYMDGSMQLYLRTDNGIAFKLDTNGDIYVFNRGDKNKLGKEFSFTFVLENDGAGGYKAKVIYENGIVEDFEILAADQAELRDFSTVWSSLDSGINVNVTFEKLTNKGLFVGCKNLKEIVVDKDNPSFKSCEHGVLYNKSMTHIIRFPEAGGHVIENCDYPEKGHRHFETPRSVTMVYAGALHDVNAHVIFHSNPFIMTIEDDDDPNHHKEHMIAKYHLVLDDDKDVIDFVSANENTFVSVRYWRKVAIGSDRKFEYGTIMLPFVPNDESLANYEFYELERGNSENLVFSEVEQLEANVPYLYKIMREDVEMKTTEEVIIKYVPDYTSEVELQSGEWKSVGSYNTKSIVTNNPGEMSSYYAINANYDFVRAKKKLTTKPYRAYYLLTPNSEEYAAAPARLTLRTNDGTTTEIDASQVEGMVAPEYYDLMGRRVLNPVNGIYIVNGRKVLVK